MVRRGRLTSGFSLAPAARGGLRRAPVGAVAWPDRSLAVGHPRHRRRRPPGARTARDRTLRRGVCRSATGGGGWSVPISAVLLGALLLTAGAVLDRYGGALVPAGGGTFDSRTAHASAPRADPAQRWSHVALTYDATALQLYVDGTRVSSRATSGVIRRTADPLWIGGNHPYGEYFRGLIDEVRVHDRALRPGEVRTETLRPVRRDRRSPDSSLVAAYAFDGGCRSVAVDPPGTGTGAGSAGQHGPLGAGSAVLCGSTAPARRFAYRRPPRWT